MGKFASAFNFITGINASSGIEFLAGLTIDDIDLSNNYFIFTGQTCVNVQPGANITNGRMTTNMFRGVTTLLNGFDSYPYGWEMQQNTGIPNIRSFAYSYIDGNVINTTFGAVGVFTKIIGTTTLVTGQKFTSDNNKFTYTGKRDITSRVFAVIGAKEPTSITDYTIAIAKKRNCHCCTNFFVGSAE